MVWFAQRQIYLSSRSEDYSGEWKICSILGRFVDFSQTSCPSVSCSVWDLLFANKGILVCSGYDMNWTMSFHRWLHVQLQGQWILIQSWVLDIQLNDSDDEVIWTHDEKGLFTVKSLYNWFVRDSPNHPFVRIWKAKIPLKIKIFLWLLEQNALLTKENTLRRNWIGDGTCYFCTQSETCQHLFFFMPHC